MFITPRFLLPLPIVVTLLSAVSTADEFTDTVQPYLQKYCVECHNSEVHKGELQLTRFTSNRDVAASFRGWNNITEFIRDGEMPPEEAQQPSLEESNLVVAAVEKILLTDALQHAGDPGIVLPRRLSNTEIDTAVRELTGVNIRPTRDFPADPAGGEGFDNTGEALSTSPNLVKKYLAAAQFVSDHLVLKPDGVSFAPFPVTSYNERKKLTEQAIIDFYESRNVDTNQYLEAAWRYRYRKADQRHLSVGEWLRAGHGSLAVGQASTEFRTSRRDGSHPLSPRYLELVWQNLSEASTTEASTGSGFLLQLAEVWNAIPPPQRHSDRPAELQDLYNFVRFGRHILFSAEPPLIKANAGNWPISHLAFRSEIAESRDRFDDRALQHETMLDLVTLQAPKADSATTYSVFLHIDSGFTDEVNFVIINKPFFSRSVRLPGNEDDRKKMGFQSLRSVLERSQPELIDTWGFGKHPAGGDVDSESFVVKAPAVVEIPVTPQMQRELSGRHLLLPCQLDARHSPEGSVFIQHAARTPVPNRYSTHVTHLIHRDSQAAKKLTESADVFCHVFPNRFFHVDDTRGLAAGFHLVEGFFRDDQPLVNKVLSNAENAELNRLWEELHFVTQSTENLLRGFVWFERSEREVLHDKRFDFLRSEDPRLIDDDLLNQFERLYLDKLGIQRIGDTLEAVSPHPRYEMIHGFFDQIRDGLKQHQQATTAAEASALEQIEQMARRAWRRPNSDADRESLRSLYATLRNERKSVEASIRGLLMAVLLSPDFCYQWTSRPIGDGIYPLSHRDLASRLSFFLWSSVPDEELLSSAASGRLQDDNELMTQTRRMLQDDRVSAFAREFFGQWLRYRDYLDKDPIHADAFPGYTDELRQAMFEEPVRLATHLIQTNQPVTALLNSDLTFLNGPLAAHYGGELAQNYLSAAGSRSDGTAASLTVSGDNSSVTSSSAWHPITGLHASGRGGLFGMGVVLTKNSAGQRTSPVKRGFWSVHHLLGQHFPPPPADVPELPTSEKEAATTIREMLAAHVSNAQCAMCHRHFDSLGLAMEGFDAIGRERTTDGAGRLIDNHVNFPDGTTGEGIPGLIEYIEQNRKQDFVRTLCRRFLGYALGRSVILSDQPLLNEMEHALESHEYRFWVIFELVVGSPQFRSQRGREFRSTR